MSELTDQDNLVDRASKPYSVAFISHSHSPPLLPEPSLKFDLRRLKNPPKHIRDAYDGRSKRLREHMLADEGFRALLDAAQAEVEERILGLMMDGSAGK